MLDQLRSLRRTVTPLVLDIYDREDNESVLALLARVLTGTGEEVQEWEWWQAFPELRKWVGERKTQEAFQDDIKVRIEPYEITYDVDRSKLDGKQLVNPEDMAMTIARGFITGKVKIAYSIMTRNDLTYDGQNFFDTDHVQPDGDLRSNVLTLGADVPARATAADPTPAEVREELKGVMSRLIQNTLVRNELVSTSAARENLVVLTRSHDVWSAFDDLLQEERIGGDINRFRGKFQLLRDFNPPAALENTYDVVQATPGGPRPVLFVADREPRGLEFDESALFKQRYIPFGMDGKYGAAAAFWQTAARVQP
jgi:hypothetical protein